MTLEAVMTARGSEHLDTVLELYRGSFPEMERMSEDTLLDLAETDGVEFASYLDDGTLRGMTYTIEGPGILYLVYLAVDPGSRSMGHGSAILSSLRGRYPDSVIVLNVEPLDPGSENIGQRIRRMDFYIGNGFHDTGYVLGDDAQEFTVVASGEGFSPDAYLDVVGRLMPEFGPAWIRPAGE